ncbi:ATP-binding protein [Sinorhizobium americanum]|nr:ATP-binding protein [Sinorhizobium americanum]
MDFQAEVGTWLAAHILARVPVGGRFGLANVGLPVNLRLETGEGLDDIELRQDDDTRIDFQSKTSAGLTQDAESPLGKTIAQLVSTMVEARKTGVAIDVEKYRAILAVGAGAPRTLENLEKGCRAFDTGGTWTAVKSQRSQVEADALDLFETHARAACVDLSVAPPSDDELVTMARLFKIVRFSTDEGEDNWREASRVLGSRVYSSETAGDTPLRDLKTIVRGLIGSGAPADREGLLRALRALGHNDTRAPGYDADLARVSAVTDAELTRLAGHTCLPIAGGTPVPRQSDGPMAAAIATGSLIVIGEPGAGKTGALVALAQARRAAGETVVFLSVDRFPGVAIAADLQSELQLARPLAEVLAAAPGAGRKLLIIDALDAARGGPAEAVFAQLIETMAAQDTSWRIAASIRTFDLRNGRRFRDAFPGSPPDPAFADPTLNKVRHFNVPRLSDLDLNRAGTDAAALGSLLDAAPERLRDLLRNIFNLSLAAQLLSDGVDPDSIRTVSTQSDMIDAYEDRRLPGTPLHRAAGATVDVMVRRGRLSIRKVLIEHDSIDEVIASGVLAETGDLVSFSHHVLFDHVAGRFFLEWDDAGRLVAQLKGGSSIALMLGPALRFAVERLWRNTGEEKGAVWRLIADIYADTAVDPVLANVALRTAIEGVSSASDIAGLISLIQARATDAAVATLLSRLARFVELSVDASGGIAREAAMAWAQVADAASATAIRGLSDPTRFLLQILFDRADLSDAPLLNLFGRASRALLTLAWAADPPMQQTAVNAIRFVGKSFASDPVASRVLLDRILRDPHFSTYADKEASWLSEQILPIARSDSDFAVEIYRVLYSCDISDDSTSHFGGQPSRIMPLSSNRRQDYRHCRYHLSKDVRQLLNLSARAGTRAAIEVALGDIDRDLQLGDRRLRVNVAGREPFDLLGNDFAPPAWDQPNGRGRNTDDDVLAQFVGFLRECPTAAFTESIGAAATSYSSPAVWARLLGVGAERVTEFAQELWPYASNLTILAHRGTVRDAARFVAAAYPHRSISARAHFEAEVLRPDLFSEEYEQRWWRRVLSRFLSSVDEASIATDAMRALRSELAIANELGGNPPLRTMTVTSGPAHGMMRRILAEEGVNVEEGVDAQMLARSEALAERVRQTSSQSDATTLSALWRETEATIAMFDANATVLHASVEQPVWGNISNAVERISGSDSYGPGVDGMPSIDVLLRVLRRLWTSRFPEPREADGSPRSYGNWAVRVYAAQAYVQLADRFGEERPEIIDMIEAVLADPAAVVRMQAAENLQVLSRVAPEKMWELASRVVCKEPNVDVLTFHVGQVLTQLIWHDVDRAEGLIQIVEQRRRGFVRRENWGRDELSEVLGGLMAQLWVGQNRERALQWLLDWLQDLVTNQDLLTAFISPLREVFIARYSLRKDNDTSLSDRAQRGSMHILETCSTAAAESYADLTADNCEGAVRETAIARYRAAEHIINHLMNQLYFGSGAYRESSNPSQGLATAEAMRSFIVDYRPMLALLAESHEPATHHHLIGLYEYLIPGDPAGVFKALHALLLGAGMREGYHHESLALKLIVRIVTRYLADYRSLFEDEVCRTCLLEILRMFSDVGWPDAMKLLYDLPELLR